MRRFNVLLSVALLSLALMSCGDSSGSGGAVDSDAALQAFMQTIALDFAQVLADVAPSVEAMTVKENGAADCPEGGAASWTESGLGGSGTLTLNACQMRGIAVSGTLAGYLELGFEPSVTGTMMTGQITGSGRFDAELFVNSLNISAQIPITDFFTYWDITATTTGGRSLCAWSGGSGCAPSPF